MRFRMNLCCKYVPAGSGLVRYLSVAVACAFLAAMLALRAEAQSPSNAMNPGGAVRTDRVHLPTAINQPPDANAQMEEREQIVKTQNFAAANAERKRQIADDSAKLLKLAAELKAEVDKTTKDTLSLSVIRKCDEIERLAHSVKEKMKLTAGAN
jgi:hypothetical protein